MDIHHAGVWSSAGELPLWNRGEENPGGTHLLSEGQSMPGGVAVAIVSIDSLSLAACDMIKIDIEGAEPHAIRSAQDTIARYRPTTVSEINPNQLRAISNDTPAGYIRVLAALGFEAFFLEDYLGGTPIDIASLRLDEPLMAVLFCHPSRR